jgi:hypothetical protein
MNVKTSTLLSISILFINCGDIDLAEDVDPWDLSEGYTVEFKYGFYKSSVEIIEDTCTPSLKDILDTTTLWPPPYSIMSSGIISPGSFIFIPFNLRAGSINLLMGLPSRDGKIRDKDSMTDTTPSSFHPDYVQNDLSRYCVGLNAADYSSTVTIRSISAEKFEIETEDNWTGFNSCDHALAMRRHAWFPEKICKEKYKIIYKFHEEIPRSCTEAYLGGSSNRKPVNPQNTAPYPDASYYPSFTKEDIALNCNQL